jgi:hypothetical protein
MKNTIKFSPHPGAFEQHLRRKYQNALFPVAQQNFLQAEIDQARQRDQQDLQAFIEAFQETMQQASGLNGEVDSKIVLDLKEQLERLYVTSCSLAGELADYQDALMKLIRVCMQTIRMGAADDPVALRKLDEEEQARTVYFAMLETPLVAELMRGDEIIKVDELLPSVFSLNQDQLRTVLELFEPEYLQALLAQAEDFVDKLDPAVRMQSEAREKLEMVQTLLARA